MKNPLTEFREARNLTAAEAAIVLDEAQPVISEVERGVRRPPKRLLARLAALGVDVAGFITDFNNFVTEKRVAMLAAVASAETEPGREPEEERE